MCFAPALLSLVSLASVQASRGAAGPTPEREDSEPALVWGDFDRDGRLDAYMVQAAGRDHLLRSRADGSLEDVTRSAFGVLSFASRSAAWGDADGDGWIDLYLAAAAGGGRLLENLRNGTFADRTREAGLAEITGRSDARWFDQDGDGRLDLLLASPSAALLLHNRGDWLFERVALPFTGPADPLAGMAVPIDRAPIGPAREDGSGNPERPFAGSGALAPADIPGSGTAPVMGGSGPSTSGGGTTGGSQVFDVPSGLMILGETATAPAGYSSTGLQVDVITGVPLWATKAPMPTARYYLAAAAVNGKVVVMGGVDNTTIKATVEIYDPVSNTWSATGNLATARYGLAAAVVNGKVYAVGGYGTSGRLAVVEEYDPVGGTWTSKAPMPTARNALAAAAVNGKVYAIAGSVDGGYTAAVEEYDPVGNTWTTRAPLPVAKTTLAAAAVNGKIYAFGGLQVLTTSAGVDEYDPVANTWTSRAPIPTARLQLAAAANDGKIYVIGGHSDFIGGTILATLEVFDPVGNTWTSKAPMPTARWGLASAELNGKVYAIGGDNGGPRATLESYDPASPSPLPLFLHSRD